MTPPLDRTLFAVTNNYTYLNHAATGVFPEPTRIALGEFIEAQATGGIARMFPYELQMPEHRRTVERFINAPAGSVAILRNTSDGANAVAGGFPWQPGDEVLLPDNEFPANAYAWLALESRGVRVRRLPMAQGRLTPDRLRREIGKNTKIVTVSWVSFADGYRHDLAALAEVAHEAGALLCVDGIQGLGAFPMDVQACGIDAFYCGGQKWLLALQGVSFLYVRPEVMERLTLAPAGWRSVADMWDFLNYDQAYLPDASRFEGGTPNFIGALSLGTSMKTIAAAGTARIAAHVLALTDALVEGLTARNAAIASARSAAESSGIVTFALPGTDSIELGKRLQSQGYVTTYRSNGIRVAPHGYNTFDEIEGFVNALRECAVCR